MCRMQVHGGRAVVALELGPGCTLRIPSLGVALGPGTGWGALSAGGGGGAEILLASSRRTLSEVRPPRAPEPAL